MENKEEIKKTLTTDKLNERDSNLSEFNERFGDPIIKVKGEVNPDYSVANNSNFCDKGWHNGDCCCNCANHIEDFYHCTTVERKYC